MFISEALGKLSLPQFLCSLLYVTWISTNLFSGLFVTNIYSPWYNFYRSFLWKSLLGCKWELKIEHNKEWVLWNALQKGEMYSELFLDISIYLFIYWYSIFIIIIIKDLHL